MKFSYVNFLRMIQKVVLRQNGTPYFEHPALAYAVDHNYIIGNYVTRSEALGLYGAIITNEALGKIERLFRALTPLTCSPHTYYPTPRRPADF